MSTKHDAIIGLPAIAVPPSMPGRPETVLTKRHVWRKVDGTVDL